MMVLPFLDARGSFILWEILNIGMKQIPYWICDYFSISGLSGLIKLIGFIFRLYQKSAAVKFYPFILKRKGIYF